MGETSLSAAKPEPIPVGTRVARGSGMMMASRLLSRLLDLGTMLILTRLLVPADFGLVAIAMTLVTVAEAAFELPINQALLRLTHVTPAHYNTAFTLGFLRGLLLLVVFVLAAPIFAALYGDGRLAWLIVALGLAPMVRGLPSPRLVEFQKQLSFWRDSIIEVLGKLAALAASATVAVLTESYWSIAVGTIVSPLIMSVSSYCLAPFWPRLSLARFKEFYGFVGWASAGSLIGSVAWQFDRLVLGKLQPMAEVGLFTTASDLAGIPFNTMFLPMIRPLMAAFGHFESDPGRHADNYQRASGAIVSVGLPVLFGLSLLAEPIVIIVLGPRWLSAAPFVRWLSLTWVPALFSFAAVPLLLASGKTKTWFVRNMIDLVVRMPISVAGVLAFGFKGIILARFVSEFSADLFSMLVVRRLLGLSLFQQVAVCSRAFLATLAMVMAVKPLLDALPPATSIGNALLSIMAAATVGGVAYGAVLFAAWIVAGRPNGLERMVWTIIAGRLSRLHSVTPRP